MPDKITTLEEESEQKLPRGVTRIPITQEMEKAYIDYAMSVIVSRAIPDVRDGLKPVQRRIVYAMYDTGLRPGARYAKSASTVGEVMKKYHPHGDMSIYDALVRMAQNFSLRYPIVDGQGNFGSIDGDPPAASRYTEAKLHKIAEYLYKDIDKSTVDFHDNYSGEFREPTVLPAIMPNLLLNGATGIAVGMATQIPPHNLSEVVDGISFLIDHIEPVKDEPDTRKIPRDITDLDTNAKLPQLAAAVKTYQNSMFSIKAGDVSIDKIMEHIKGPDFPTGAMIYDAAEIKNMYSTGRGKIMQRAKTNIEEAKGGKYQIIVTEVPFQVNKAVMVQKIAELVRDKKVIGVTDLRDESNRQGIRVVIELAKSVRPQKILNQLYKHTDLQTAFNANLVGLVNSEPKTLTIKLILEEFIKHRIEVIVRRTIFLLNKALEREHILQGLKKALDIIDEVIETIRASKTSDDARKNLVKNFGFTEFQAEAILEMQLRRLAALERQKVEDELKEVQNTIEGYNKLLSAPENILAKIKTELAELKEKFGDPRRTKIYKSKVGEFEEEDLIEDEQCIVSLTASGYIKRVKYGTYKTQGRGGKGVASSLKEEDQIFDIFTCSTHDEILFFSNKGKVYNIKAWNIPETSRNAKGSPVVNIIDIDPSEKVTSVLPLNKKLNAQYIFFATKNGIVKKTEVKEFQNIRTSGIIAIRLSEGDELRWAKPTNGSNAIMLFTRQGQSIRFSENDARPMGRAAGGVKGIALKKKDDKVVGMDVITSGVDEHQKVLAVSERGYGKATKVEEYKTQTRGGSGIKTYSITKKTGLLTKAKIISDEIKDILIISARGKVIKLETKSISTLGRSTSGVKLIKLDQNDAVASLALFYGNNNDES